MQPAIYPALVYPWSSFFLKKQLPQEVTRHRASGHSNDGMAVPLGGYAVSNFAGSAMRRGTWIPQQSENVRDEPRWISSTNASTRSVREIK
jgi:hypothetical protein